MLCDPAAETPAQVVATPICTGVFLSMMVPSPNIPLPLYPHPHNVPSDLIARLWLLPPETATQLVAVPICTGTFFSVLVPSPNCPYVLSPHAQSVPSVLIATLWLPPAEMLDHIFPPTHPAALVPVTVYVVVLVGETDTLAPLNAPGVQVYVEAPLAVNVVPDPTQIVAGDADAVTVGNWFVATVIEMGDDIQPPVVTVAIMVWLPAVRPVIVNGLLLNDCADPPSTV